MSDDGAYVIETQLLRWNEGPSGRTVTLLLPDDTPQHPFRGLRTGPANGQRLAISVALINDHEEQQPLEQPSQAPQKATDGPKPNGSNGHRLSQQAGIVCQEGAFKRFLNEYYGHWAEDVADVARWVRRHCGVDSRSELDTDEGAAATWKTVYADYQLWLQAVE